MPGPSSPGQAALTRLQLQGPKIGGTGSSFGPSFAELQAGQAKVLTDEVTQVWQTFAIALGQTAPAHVNRLQQATRNLRRYGG